MAIINKITWKNNGVEVIDHVGVNNRYFWLNENHIEIKICHSNLPVVTNKYDLEYKKHRYELVDEPKYQPFRRFIRNDLAEKLINILGKDKMNVFKNSLRFNVTDTFISKEQTVLASIKEIFD